MKTSLTFSQYGNQYFFAQAWMPGNDGSAAKRDSAAARNAERNGAAH
jgi:hypothetical protein